MSGDLEQLVTLADYQAAWKPILRTFEKAKKDPENKDVYLSEAVIQMEALPKVDESKIPEEGLYSVILETQEEMREKILFSEEEPDLDELYYATVQILTVDIEEKNFGEYLLEEIMPIRKGIEGQLEKYGDTVDYDGDKWQYTKDTVAHFGKELGAGLTKKYKQNKEKFTPAKIEEKTVENILDLYGPDAPHVLGESLTIKHIGQQRAKRSKKLVNIILSSDMKEETKRVVLEDVVNYALEDPRDLMEHLVSTMLMRTPQRSAQVLHDLAIESQVGSLKVPGGGSLAHYAGTQLVEFGLRRVVKGIIGGTAGTIIMLPKGLYDGATATASVYSVYRKPQEEFSKWKDVQRSVKSIDAKISLYLDELEETDVFRRMYHFNPDPKGNLLHYATEAKKALEKTQYAHKENLLGPLDEVISLLGSPDHLILPEKKKGLKGLLQKAQKATPRGTNVLSFDEASWVLQTLEPVQKEIREVIDCYTTVREDVEGGLLALLQALKKDAGVAKSIWKIGKGIKRS